MTPAQRELIEQAQKGGDLDHPLIAEWLKDPNFRRRITEALAQDPIELAALDRVFWIAMRSGLDGGVAAWGRLYSEIRQWTGRLATDRSTPEDSERISDEEARALVAALPLDVLFGETAGE